jgi:hypothetical protein
MRIMSQEKIVNAVPRGGWRTTFSIFLNVTWNKFFIDIKVQKKKTRKNNVWTEKWNEMYMIFNVKFVLWMTNLRQKHVIFAVVQIDWSRFFDSICRRIKANCWMEAINFAKMENNSFGVQTRKKCVNYWLKKTK